MLPKENRLSKKEVELVLKKGRTYRGFFLILKYWKNKLSSEDKRLSRFAVIVPQKVSKKATKRNRIKRLIRENLRKRLSQIKFGFDVVFMATPEILNKNYWQIGKEVERLLRLGNLRK
ncbi:ribonuclease P protein component [bacterium]|nr:ribonuclease P protein component [bacterium]